MQTSKGFSLILALVIIVAVLAGGAYLYTKNKTVVPASNLEAKPPSAATSTAVDTSDWKTYRNNEYGFEFKYPPNLVQQIIDDKDTDPSERGTCLLLGNYDTQTNLDFLSHGGGDATGVMDFCVADSKELNKNNSSSVGEVIIPLRGYYSVKFNDGTYGIGISPFPLVIRSFRAYK